MKEAEGITISRAWNMTCSCQSQVLKTHYSDIIMGAIASQITSLTIVYSTFYSGADQRKHQSSASLAFVRGIHRWPVTSPHKGPVTRKMFSFDDVIMKSSLLSSLLPQLTALCHLQVDMPLSHLLLILITETEISSGWLSWLSLETLKLIFNVSSDTQDNQGSHSDDISVSDMVYRPVYEWSDAFLVTVTGFNAKWRFQGLVLLRIFHVKIHID